MKYTIIYLEVNKLPRESFKLQLDVKNEKEALFSFLNLEISKDMFIAAIVKGPIQNIFCTS